MIADDAARLGGPLADLPPAVGAALILAVAVALGVAAYALLYGGLARLGRRAPSVLVLDGAFLRRTRRPASVLLPLLAAHAALPALRPVLSPSLLAVCDLAVHLALIAAVAWMLIAVTFVLEDVVDQRYDVSVADNLRARRVRTQVSMLRRVIAAVVGFVALSVALMRIEGLQDVGAGLLASAGIIGIVVGIAAQRPLGNLVAGIQLAVTQPMRVGDAVVVEGEWGTVEEITLTYVVVRIWDARRLVLPISYFLEHPFQNWTRETAQIVGSVFLKVDFAAPVAEIRAECERVVRASPHWDGQVWALDVTDATDRALELRAIMSAANSGAAWNLRCEVREKLVDFLRRELPEALPRLRVSGADGAPREAAGAAALEGGGQLPAGDARR